MKKFLTFAHRFSTMSILILLVIVAALLLTGCRRACETEPIVEENQRLIVPPGFGRRPS